MSNTAYIEPIDSTEEIMRMVREETVLRPARRAAAFAALVIAFSTFGFVADRTTVDSLAIGNLATASELARSEAVAEPVTLLEADGDAHRLAFH
jgi:hypothetical protein